MTWEQAIAELDADDPDRYAQACENLDRLATPDHLPQLLDLLATGRDFTIREAAALPIARLQGVAALPALLAAMRRGADEGHDNDLLASLISDIVSEHPIGAAPLLNDLVASASERDREYGAWLWGFASDQLDPEPLLALARDPSAEVRCSALGSLAGYPGRENVFRALLAGLKDADASARVSAVSALGYFGDARALSHIAALSDDPDERVRQFVAHATEQLKGRGDVRP